MKKPEYTFDSKYEAYGITARDGLVFTYRKSVDGVGNPCWEEEEIPAEYLCKEILRLAGRETP